MILLLFGGKGIPNIAKALGKGIREFKDAAGGIQKDIQESIKRAEEDTARYTERTLSIALSYGGRAEIVDAVRRLPPETLPTLSADELEKLLWTKDIPDADIIIRTGGEKRLSGFLTWKSTYSELFFIDDLWPDFSRETFARILESYGRREKRFGK